MPSKSDNLEIMISDVTDEIIEKLLNSVKNRCQNNLQSMRSCEFVFNYIHLLCHKCHKMTFMIQLLNIIIDYLCRSWVYNRKN